jgi:EmrB/QacA subfamily drug resistance transporter
MAKFLHAPRPPLPASGLDSEPLPARPWPAFVVIAVAIFLTTLDLFIVNVGLPAIAADFPGASLSSLSWVVTGYAVGFAAALVPAGKLGDLYGRRRLFSGGLILFLAGSAMAAAAGSIAILIAARVVQAVGAAAMTPNSLGLALTLFPAQRRPGVIAAWGAIAGLGAAAGPLAGALLAEADWRWIFIINLPPGIAALVLVPRMIREVRDIAARRLPDGLGAVTLAAGVGLLVLALSRGPAWGWDGRVWASIAAAALLGLVLVWRSARHPVPIIELSMFGVRSFTHAMAATVFLWAGFAALLVSSALFLTGVWGYSVLKAGLALAPGPAVSAPFAALSGRLGKRFGPARVGAFGAALFAIGAGWEALALAGNVEYASAFLPAQLLVGAGVGLTIPTLVTIALAEMPASRFSTGTAVYSTFRQIGTALGVAVWVATLSESSPADAASFDTGWAFIAAMAAAATVAIATSPRRSTVSGTIGSDLQPTRSGDARHPLTDGRVPLIEGEG